MKIKLLFFALLAIVASSCATLSEQPPAVQVIQKEPDMLRLYVVDIPRTDDMIFKNVLPDTNKIIGTSNIKGEGRFLLVNNPSFEVIKSLMEEYKELYTATKEIPLDRYVGLELSASRIGKLSLISEKQISEMKSTQLKELARTLNEYNKYTLIGESPKPVLMQRLPDGRFVPDFSITSTSSIRSSERKMESTPPVSSQPKNAWQELLDRSHRQ